MVYNHIKQFLLSTDTHIRLSVSFSHIRSLKMDKLCMTCGKSFSSKNWSRHQKSHDTEKKFDCYQCSKKFNTKAHLVEHIQTHRKPLDVKCELCSKVVHSQNALRKHVKTRHENFKYCCPHCNNQFTVADYCQAHIKRCNFGTKVSCYLCNETFKNELTLENHPKSMCELCFKQFECFRKQIQINLQ